MKQLFIRIVTWLAIMGGLALLVVCIWYVALGAAQTTESLKWLQFLQTVGTFLLPPILCAALWDTNHRPFAWLKMNTGAHWSLYVIAVGIMVCALPGINLLANLNSRIELPESLDFIEQILKQQEETAALLTERFLKADNVGGLLINLALLALLPALAEELSFRGTLQQILSPHPLTTNPLTPHVAIWLTAIVFSAIHMQFYGFIPRMLMGAMFGYIFVWSGSLWLPIVMHFTNNALAVVTYYLITNTADTFGAGDTWYIGVISILITSLGLLIFYRRTRTR